MRTNVVLRICTPLLALLAICLIVTPVQAVSLWETADFSGTDQKWTGAVDSGGALEVGPEGGLIPAAINPFGIDIFIVGPQLKPLIQSAPSPHPFAFNPVSLDSDASGLPTGGPMIHFDGDTWFPEDISSFHLDLLNGGVIPIEHDPVLADIILGFPTAPPGSPALLDTDLDLYVVGWTFWQTGPAVFTDPGAAHSEYFIPGIHRLVLDSHIVTFGGAVDIPILEGEVVDVPLGLSGTMWSEHGPGMGLQTTLMGDIGAFLPFDAALDIAGIGGTGTVTLTGGATVGGPYMLTTTVVPEPSSVILFGLGIVGVFVAIWRRRKRVVK